MYCNITLRNHLLVILPIISVFVAIQGWFSDPTMPSMTQTHSRFLSHYPCLVTFIVKIFLQSQYGHQSSCYHIQVTDRKKKQKRAKGLHNLFLEAPRNLFCSYFINQVLISYGHSNLKNIIFQLSTLLLSLRHERKKGYQQESSSVCNKRLRKIKIHSPVELCIPLYHVKFKSLPEFFLRRWIEQCDRQFSQLSGYETVMNIKYCRYGGK